MECDRIREVEGKRTTRWVLYLGARET